MQNWRINEKWIGSRSTEKVSSLRGEIKNAKSQVLAEKINPSECDEIKSSARYH